MHRTTRRKAAVARRLATGAAALSSHSPANPVGPSSNSYYVNGGYFAPSAGYCSYTRLIATDTGALDGPAESPATCF